MAGVREYSEAELKQLLMSAAIELDSIRGSAQSQMQLQEAQIAHLKEILERVRRERDEKREECVRLTNKLEYIQAGAIDTGCNNKCISTAPGYDHSAGSAYKHNSSFLSSSSRNIHENVKPLPERGKLVEAVLQAGPLLQTLLVSGPLPQWRHPPPSIQSLQQMGPIIQEANSPGLLCDCYTCKNVGIESPVFASTNNFVHGDQNLCLSNMNTVSTGFSSKSTHNNEECNECQTVPTATKPEMGMFQASNSKFGFGCPSVLGNQSF
ncbi:uncharacterized protein LOC131056090 [Cryptomeria japonica]|uniref:uncharacterized protein LOC131056090 n=1 Tax=Cryptomeria japonica TaxID=3369 RepID=UPI0027D9F8E1|nr:uncharacterized protein LOC131056090 [Cryptomeria japonica]